MPRKSRTRRIGRGFTSTVAFDKLRRALTKQLEKCGDEEVRAQTKLLKQQNSNHNNNGDETSSNNNIQQFSSSSSSIFSSWILSRNFFSENNISPLTRKLSSIIIIYSAILLSCVIVSFFHSLLDSDSDANTPSTSSSPTINNNNSVRNQTLTVTDNATGLDEDDLREINRETFEKLALLLPMTFFLAFLILLLLDSVINWARKREAKNRILRSVTLCANLLNSSNSSSQLHAANRKINTNGSMAATKPSGVVVAAAATGSYLGAPIVGMKALLKCRAFGLCYAIRDGKVIMLPSAVLVPGDVIVAPRLYNRLFVTQVKKDDSPLLVIAARILLNHFPVQLPPSTDLVPPEMRADLSDSGGTSSSSSSSESDTSDDEDMAGGDRRLMESSESERTTSSSSSASASDSVEKKHEQSSVASKGATAQNKDEVTEKTPRWQPRSKSSPSSPPLPHDRMEYFVSMFLVAVTVLVASCLCVIRFIALASSNSTSLALDISDSLFQSVLSVLGFLPIASIVLSKAIGTWLNARLVCFCKLASKNADKLVEERLHYDELRGHLDPYRIWRQLRQCGALDGAANCLCFSRDPVHSLNATSVVASLDGDAVLTESALLPVRIALPVTVQHLQQIQQRNNTGTNTTSAGGAPAAGTTFSFMNQTSNNNNNNNTSSNAKRKNNAIKENLPTHNNSINGSTNIFASSSSVSAFPFSASTSASFSGGARLNGIRLKTFELDVKYNQETSSSYDDEKEEDDVTAADSTSHDKKGNGDDDGEGGDENKETLAEGKKTEEKDNNRNNNDDDFPDEEDENDDCEFIMTRMNRNTAAARNNNNDSGNDDLPHSVLSFINQQQQSSYFGHGNDERPDNNSRSTNKRYQAFLRHNPHLRYKGSLYPLAMCALLHSVHSTQFASRSSVRHHGEVALMQALDHTILWSRAMHWLPRALNFDDRNACTYRLLRRILVVKRRGSVLQHKCALIFENLEDAESGGEGGSLHVYCIGTFDSIINSCTTGWVNGEELAPLKLKDVELARKRRWPKRIAPVGISHRLLPAKFKKWLEIPKSSSPGEANQQQKSNDNNNNNNQTTNATTTKEKASKSHLQDFAEDYLLDSELIFSSCPPRHQATTTTTLNYYEEQHQLHQQEQQQQQQQQYPRQATGIILRRASSATGSYPSSPVVQQPQNDQTQQQFINFSSSASPASNALIIQQQQQQLHEGGKQSPVVRTPVISSPFPSSSSTTKRAFDLDADNSNKINASHYNVNNGASASRQMYGMGNRAASANIMMTMAATSSNHFLKGLDTSSNLISVKKRRRVFYVQRSRTPDNLRSELRLPLTMSQLHLQILNQQRQLHQEGCQQQQQQQQRDNGQDDEKILLQQQEQQQHDPDHRALNNMYSDIQLDECDRRLLLNPLTETSSNSNSNNMRKIMMKRAATSPGGVGAGDARSSSKKMSPRNANAATVVDVFTQDAATVFVGDDNAEKDNRRNKKQKNKHQNDSKKSGSFSNTSEDTITNNNNKKKYRDDDDDHGHQHNDTDEDDGPETDATDDTGTTDDDDDNDDETGVNRATERAAEEEEHHHRAHRRSNSFSFVEAKNITGVFKSHHHHHINNNNNISNNHTRERSATFMNNNNNNRSVSRFLHNDNIEKSSSNYFSNNNSLDTNTIHNNNDNTNSNSNIISLFATGSPGGNFHSPLDNFTAIAGNENNNNNAIMANGSKEIISNNNNDVASPFATRRSTSGTLTGDDDNLLLQQQQQHQQRVSMMNKDTNDNQDEYYDEEEEEEEDLNLLTPEAVLMATLEEHTFLGAVGLGTSMHPEVDTNIALLGDAGVRVVHFSEHPLREAKSYGMHIGLSVSEINSCVSLRDADKDARDGGKSFKRGGLDFEYKRAQLPCGIGAIRNHLRFFDTIPLAVPMFCDCTGPKTRDMLSIMQDNHEVVCTFGAPKAPNVRAMMQADVAFTVDPDPLDDCAVAEEDLLNRVNEEAFSRPNEPARRSLNQIHQLCNSVAAVSGMRARYGLPLLSLAIREARISAKRIANTVEFVVSASASVALLRTLSSLAGYYHQTLSPWATVFLLYVTIPVMAVGVVLAPPHRDVMSHMPSKHKFQTRLLMLRAWCLWFALRYIPTVLVCFLIFSVNHSSCVSKYRNATIERFNNCLDATQSITLVVFTVLLALHSICGTSPYFSLYYSLKQTLQHNIGGGATESYGSSAAMMNNGRDFGLGFYKRRHNQNIENNETSPSSSAGQQSDAFWLRLWRLHRATLLLSSFATVLTIGIFISLEAAPPKQLFSIILFIVYCPIQVFVIDAGIKRVRYSRMLQRQKYLRLSFCTRLGMHSPVGALEEVAPEVTTTYKPSANYMGKWISKLFHFLSLEDGQGELACECCERPLPY